MEAEVECGWIGGGDFCPLGDPDAGQPDDTSIAGADNERYTVSPWCCDSGVDEEFRQAYVLGHAQRIEAIGWLAIPNVQRSRLEKI
jgi:hypothetical protein